MMDLVKAPIILFGYLILAPLLGFLGKGSRKVQGWIFAMMAFMTSWHINKFTLMLCSVEKYRGHTKGFEFSFIEILALSLIIASVLERKPADRAWRWLPPGAILYLLYCAASWASVFAAPDLLYALMGGVRLTKAVIIFIGAYHFIRKEEDLPILLKALAFTLVVQAIVVLKMKYVDHFYQVRGWFEHQNPLAMWAYMGGLPLLATAMTKVSQNETRWYAAGFTASAIIVQSSLSRASLLAFAAGVILVVGLATVDRITPKRVVFVLGMSAVGCLGLLLCAHTIIARFHDEGNQASGETRVVMNLASKEMLHHSPVGIGLNNFALTINHPFPYGDVIDDAERDHGHKVDEDYAKGVVESHYWLLLAETGYPGWAAYLLFIAATLWWCLRGALYWRGEIPAAFLGGLFVALLLVYLHSNLERVLTQTKNFSMWFILLGAAARLETLRRAARR
ncbi:MAG: O-antigen ligase family protein [Verrucomicrobiota bacterium]